MDRKLESLQVITDILENCYIFFTIKTSSFAPSEVLSVLVDKIWNVNVYPFNTKESRQTRYILVGEFVYCFWIWLNPFSHSAFDLESPLIILPELFVFYISISWNEYLQKIRAQGWRHLQKNMQTCKNMQIKRDLHHED